MHASPALLAVTILFAGRGALAETHTVAPAGGGLPALDVTVELTAAAVNAGGSKISIPLEEKQLPSEKDVTVEPISIGQGRHVVHVRIPARDSALGVAWEALLAAGKRQPIFAGLTGLVGGDPGERTGKALQVVENGPTSFVLVGDMHEDLGICGQAVTLLDPLALYPASLELRPATVQRLGAEQRATAKKIVAVDKGRPAEAPLAKLLVARGSSVPGSQGAELTDGDPRTVWSEKRPGMGQGEFVVMAAPKEVPIARMQVVVAPPGAPVASGAAPKTFYLVTNAQTFEVTLPEDAWLKPGESYEIAFPEPIAASCVTLVLDTAHTRGEPHPVVGIAELVAYSEFDAPGVTLGDVAKKLSTERGIAAAQVLLRAGDGALAAVGSAYEALDPRAKALAMDVAASHDRCDEAAPLLVRGLCSVGGEAPRKAYEKLERCKGAAPVLAKSLREDPPRRSCVAPALAAMAPEEALDPIADAMAQTSEADGQTRTVLRGAFARALASAPSGKLAALIGDARRSAAARLEIMRAAQARVTEAPAASEATVAELLGGSAPMRTRYLVLSPLEELARGGDRAAAARLADAIAHDSEWPVRARAAQAGGGIADLQESLVLATRDPEPRVREAALESLAAASPAVPQPAAGGVQAAAAILEKDSWSFVKAQAVAVLARAPASAEVDGALAGALRDRWAGVRGAALVALGRHRAWPQRKAIRERLDDPDEDPEVRAAAAHGLGAVCDAASADHLTELARGLALPGTGEAEQQVALGALVGLAALQPSDLRGRVGPLLAPTAPPSVRAAAQQALSAHSACR